MMNATKPNVVFTFSYETLDDCVSRQFCRPPDQALLALAADDRVGRLLAADPWRFRVRPTGRVARLLDIGNVTLNGRTVSRVRPHRWRREDPLSLSSVESSYVEYGRLLGRALAADLPMSGSKPPTASVVTYHPFVAAFCDSPWISRVVYLGRDDWAAHPSFARWHGLYEDAYRRIDARGALIFTVSQELADRVSPRSVAIPNGVASDLWRRRYPPPPWLDRLRGPRAVYTGTIDANRLDLGLVEKTAAAVGSFVIVGYQHDDDVVHRLRSIENVHVFGPVSQEALVASVQACDIGVLPHRNTSLTRAMSPLKIYEYLAGGLPVVSVDLPPVRDVASERILIRDRNSWVSGVADALAIGNASDDARQRFIAGASWEHRMRPIVDAAVGGF